MAPQSGDTLTFAGSTRLTPNLDNSYTLASLTFSNTAGSFVIGTANNSALILTGGLTNNSANVQTLNVPVAVNTTAAINTTNGSITLGGVVSGSSGLTLSGTHTLTLAGATSIYTGPTTISVGNMVLGASGLLGSGGTYTGNITNNGSLTVNNNVAQTLGGNISGTGSLTNNGGGTLTLSGVNTYSGSLTIIGGTVKLGSATAPGKGTITLAGGTLAPNFAATTAFTNAMMINGGGTIAPTITSATLIGLVTGNGSLTINLPAGFIYNLGGTGAGTQFAGFSGSISISASTTTGTLKLRNDSGPATDKGMGNVALDLGTFTSAHLSEKFTSGTGANSGSVTQTIGSLSGGGATVVEGADANPGANIYTFNVGTLNTDSEFDGVLGLAGRGTLAITKSGTGRWTLGGVNIYTGNTTISNGVLALGQFNGADASIGNSAVISIKSGAVFDVTGRSDLALTLNTNQQLNGRGTLVGNLTTALR